MRARSTALLVVLACSATAVGCTSTEPGGPVRAATTSSHQPVPEAPVSDPDGRYGPPPWGAPPVRTPLDARGFLDRPCAVLSPEQRASLHISEPGDPDTESPMVDYSGPSCAWITDEKPFQGYSVDFLTGNEYGLGNTYLGHRMGVWEEGYFEPTSLHGHPAVFNGSTDSRDQGRCVLTVGLSDTLAFQVFSDSAVSRGAASCDRAVAVASAVLITVKASN